MNRSDCCEDELVLPDAAFLCADFFPRYIFAHFYFLFDLKCFGQARIHCDTQGHYESGHAEYGCQSAADRAHDYKRIYYR